MLFTPSFGSISGLFVVRFPACLPVVSGFFPGCFPVVLSPFELRNAREEHPQEVGRSQGEERSAERGFSQTPQGVEEGGRGAYAPSDATRLLNVSD
jgi:hypothetical protein